MRFTFLVAAATCQSFAMRPALLRAASAADEDTAEEECPQLLQPPPSTAADPACFLTKGGYNDGIGHQLFGTLSVMGMHGQRSDLGHCYVYSTAPRDFAFHHLKEGSEAWDEGQHLMSKLYETFRSKYSARGCATAELIARDPSNRVPMCKNTLLLGEIPCHESSTWELDNMWYGADHHEAQMLQLRTFTPFMQAVVRNATELAALASSLLPHADEKPSVAVHMRFGDRKPVVAATLLGQLAFFEHSDANLAQIGPMHVFTDGAWDAKVALNNTAFEGASIHGPDSSTVLQAIARMVEADVFIGSRSDVSSCAALMRIGLGKKHTYMPERWAWVKAFSEEKVTAFAEIQPEGQ